MNRMRVEEVILVEGKYDAVKLADLVDGLILTTNGFSIFHNEAARQLIRELGKKRGIMILTDSDAAGFRIRSYICQIAEGIPVKNAYIPAIAGKERRKAAPSKEGLLGVEGVPAEAVLRALRTAGAHERAARAGRAITYADLYEWGLSGTAGSAGARRAWLQSIGLPPRLSKKALCEVLNSLYTYEELARLLPPRDGAPAAKNKMPEAGQRTAFAAGKTPAAGEKTPAAKGKTPAAKEKTPAAGDEAPTAKGETPAAGAEAKKPRGGRDAKGEGKA